MEIAESGAEGAGTGASEGPGETDTRGSYDRIAPAYADRFRYELADKPLDRMLLDHIATRTRGVLADIGCGPGHVAHYLAERGAETVGMDLSARMIEIASAAHPRIDFQVGDMRRLPAPDAAWAGIVAFYSIIHLPPDELPTALAEFHRTLRPGGIALLSFHLGDEVRRADEMLGHPVTLDFQFYPRETVERELTAAGLTPEAYLERRPYDVEVPTRRAYVLATRAG